LLDLGARKSTSGRIAFDQLARDSARSLLREIVSHLGTLEAMWSFGVAAAEHGWSYPRPAAQLRAVGLVHPFLGRAAVGNDLHLGNETRVCFVTGPNMAGKSTFLKAVALATVLAHSGCGVPAASMEFPIVRTIFSSVQIADNIGAGESFYLAEVRRIKSLAAALRDHHSAIAVLDEPFRGTNVHDAAEATLAVIARLVITHRCPRLRGLSPRRDRACTGGRSSSVSPSLLCERHNRPAGLRLQAAAWTLDAAAGDDAAQAGGSIGYAGAVLQRLTRSSCPFQSLHRYQWA
jgi:hypothetical protein